MKYDDNGNDEGMFKLKLNNVSCCVSFSMSVFVIPHVVNVCICKPPAIDDINTW